MREAQNNGNRSGAEGDNYDSDTVSKESLLRFQQAARCAGPRRMRGEYSDVRRTRIVAQALLAIPDAPPACFAHWARQASVLLIPLDSHYPSETLGRYKKGYSSQAPFAAHAGEQVATVLWRSGNGRMTAGSDPFESIKPSLLRFCCNGEGFLWRFEHGYVGDFIPKPLPGDIVPRPLHRFAPVLSGSVS